MAEKIERGMQFEDSPTGWAKRWEAEFAGARKALEDWHRQGSQVEDRYRDEREANRAGDSRLNLFHGDTESKKAILFGNLPQVRVARKFGDSNDDVARVAGVILERHLQCDIERDSDTYIEAMELARDDRLLTGMGQVRARYEVEFGTVETVPGAPAKPVKTYEDAPIDYMFWRDFLWSPCRFWREVRWGAGRVEMTREELHKRFDEVLGEDVVRQISLNADKKTSDDKGPAKDDPWSRAEVWEVWLKQPCVGEDGTQYAGEVFWFVEGFHRILDRKKDPLGLSGFFPWPKPMFANLVNSKLVPKPDFAIAQDLYNEIDELTFRISLLEQSLRVAGVYDGSQGDAIGSLAKGRDNVMIPLSNWAMFAEKGGLKGAVDWFPVETVANTLNILCQKRLEKIALKDQVTGVTDAMRGGSSGGKTATEVRVQSRSASTRTQLAQKEFARFATDVQRIRAEIIVKHFDARTIIERSNIMNTPDAQYAEAAVEMLKKDFPSYRIEVSADSLSMTDYDALKQERTEVVATIGGLLQQAAPAVQALGPPALKLFADLGKWVIASTRGSSTGESMFDEFVEAMEQQMAQPKPPPPPDPKAEADKMRAQVDITKSKMDMQHDAARHQMDMTKLAAEVQADRMHAETEVMRARAMPREPQNGGPNG